jgi:hypothetical protein
MNLIRSVTGHRISSVDRAQSPRRSLPAAGGHPHRTPLIGK